MKIVKRLLNLNYELLNTTFEPPNHAFTLLPNLRWRMFTNVVTVKGTKIVVDCNLKTTPFQVLKLSKIMLK